MLGKIYKHNIIVGFYVRRTGLKLILSWAFCLVAMSCRSIMHEMDIIQTTHNNIVNIKLDNEIKEQHGA